MPRKSSDMNKPWTDPDDAPELTEAWFAEADLHEGERLVRKGGRPKSDAPKKVVSIRLDPDLLEHFRASGPGWQTRVNDLLRKAAGLSRTG